MSKSAKHRSNFYPDKEHHDAFAYCVGNDIKVYPLKRKGGFILVLEKDGTKQSSGKIHTAEQLDEMIWKFYLYIYKKLCSK